MCCTMILRQPSCTRHDTLLLSPAFFQSTDHRLTDELSRTLDRPDLAVMVGRNTLTDGSNDFTVVGYPSVKLPAGHQGDFTIVHAIARQESQFDRAAVRDRKSTRLNSSH